MIPYAVIHAKKKNQALSDADITGFVEGYMAGDVSEAQMAAFLMAVRLNGMSEEETFALTRAMAMSGTVIDTSEIPNLLDKHSTGGVGDKTTFLVGSMLSAAGYKVGMMSGRGLGHTGGTIDKLESIPGFTSELNPKEYLDAVRSNGFAIISQTSDIAPADKRMYELRNMTATIDSIPLIASSIMSKKIASGTQNIVLDVKYGPAAFLKTRDESTALGRIMEAIGRDNDISTIAHTTSSQDVLGNEVGNAVEIGECVDIMCGEMKPGTEELVTLSLDLATSVAMETEEKSVTAEKAVRSKLLKTLNNGEALRAFYTFLIGQKGQINRPAHDSIEEIRNVILDCLPMPDTFIPVYGNVSGIVYYVDAEEIGMTAARLGANRLQSHDTIFHDVGIRSVVHLNDQVQENEPIAIIEYSSELSGKRTEFQSILEEEVAGLAQCWVIR